METKPALQLEGFINKNIPIIAITADVTDGAERRVKKVGMDIYFAKPVNKIYFTKQFAV